MNIPRAARYQNMGRLNGFCQVANFGCFLVASFPQRRRGCGEGKEKSSWRILKLVTEAGSIHGTRGLRIGRRHENLASPDFPISDLLRVYEEWRIRDMYHNKLRYPGTGTRYGLRRYKARSSLGQAEDEKMIWSFKKVGAPPATAILQILHSLSLSLSLLLCSPLIFPAIAGADARQTP
jgi:hypothetical protein